MVVDRYTRVVLTVIAACLVYLCLVVSRVGTPLSAQQQQAGAPPVGTVRPGLSTGPAEVVVVGWRVTPEDPPVSVAVQNTVTTQAAPESATRVVVAGWEDRRTNAVIRLGADGGLPVDGSAALGPSRTVLVGTDSMPGTAWRERIPVETGKAAPKR